MSERRKILVNAPLDAEGLRHLEDSGYVPVIVPESDPQGSYEAAPECVGMVANASLPIDDAFFAKAPHLRVVGRMGVGCDNVDAAAATRRGVRVVNTPLPVIEPVAEHTILLMLAVARKLVPGDHDVRQGRWRAPRNAPGPELEGKRLGIIGMGNTGRRVAEIAVAGFRMSVSYFDEVERPDVERALGARRVSLDDLLRESDVVSVHVSLTPATRGLMDARAFSLMKPGAIFINVSRGGVVVEEALLEALRSDHLGGAGLDVYAVEPPGKDNALWEMANVAFTPHVAGFSVESRRGCSRVAEDIVRVLRGEEPKHPVN